MVVRGGVTLMLLLGLVLAQSVSAQRQSRDPAVLSAEGWKAVEEKRFGDALDAFTAARALAPRESTLWLGAGLAAYMLGNSGEAETSLERALSLQPRLSDASLLLGELQYRSGRARDAIATYEAALKLNPGEKAFTDRIAQWTKESRLQDRFYESRGAHFRVLFEGPADDAMARRAVELLEAAYWRIGSALTAYPPREINVILYTQQQFQDVTQSPGWVAAVYDGQIRVPVRGALDRPVELERVLAHEFVHAVVAMLGGRGVPVWLNEGLATYFQPKGLADAKEVLSQVTGRPRLNQLHGSWFSLSGPNASIAYSLSAVAVERMITLRGAPAVVMLLQDVGRGAEFAPAFFQRMSMPYDEFDRMVTR